MIMTDLLENIVVESKIIKEFVQLPEHVLGFYSYEDRLHFILIDVALKSCEKLYRIVLAEELGHYFTTVGDITPRKHMCYRDRLQVDKKELAALKWAVDFLIPTDMVIDMLRGNICFSIKDAADYFGVTEEFVLRKFEFMSKQKSIWTIDDNRSLCLYNLPSIFVYHNMDDV